MLKSNKRKVSVIYICSQKDTICPPGYYQSANGPMVTHAFGHMMHGYTLLVPVNQRVLNKSSKENKKTGYARCLTF